MLSRLIPLMSLLVLALVPGRSHAETVLCTEITSVPYTIATAGKYCLNRDLIMTASGNNTAAIRIEASSVELDCNGHQISKYSASSAIYGIYVRSRRQVTVRDCALHRFGNGIALSRVSSSRVLDNRVSFPDAAGIYVAGDDVEIARNHVYVDHGYGDSPPESGILVAAYWTGLPVRAQITDNITQGVFGINVFGGDLVVIERNRVDGKLVVGSSHDDDDPTAAAIPSRGLVRNNVVRGKIMVLSKPFESNQVVCSENYLFVTAADAESATTACLTDSKGNTVTVLDGA